MLSNNISIDQLFNKKYTLQYNHTNLSLPDADLLFNADPWYDKKFQDQKNSLNLQKSKLNDYDLLDWQNHTLRTNPAKDVLKTVRFKIKPELLTIAWMKFYECASNFDIVSEDAKINKNFNTVHLCEAPGAFVTSLNHFLKLKYKDLNWKWLATTLNPYYEGNSMTWMVCDDRFIKHTLGDWSFGSDFTGDIMDWNNAESIIKKAKTMGKIHLVTADGSIDCSLNPAEQEADVASLHYCEAIAALHMLDEGGTFIFKIFTTYEHHTINLIYLLAACFVSVNFYKPVTSKPGNSEVYLICLKYTGYSKIEPIIHKLKEHYGNDNFSTKAMLPHNFLPEKFMDDLLHSSYTYYYYQYCTIEENVNILQNANSQASIFGRLMKIQKSILKRYMNHYELRPISETIVSQNKYKKFKTLYRNIFHIGNYYERLNSSNISVEERVSKIKDIISKYDNEFNFLPTIIESNILKKYELMFRRGKPITQINSSCFVDPHIFKMYVDLKSSLNLDKNLSKLPRREKLLKNHIINCEFFNFEDYYEGWEKFSIVHVLRVLDEMDPSDNLVLENFDLLFTQFGVGFLYLLGCQGFEKIIFHDSKICLYNLKDKIGLTFKLKSLNVELKTHNKMALLTIFPIEVFFLDIYLWTIVNFNSLRLYKYIKNNAI